MRIIDLISDDRDRLGEAAALLRDGFSDTGSAAWSTYDAALREVEESLQTDRISRAAVDDAGHVMGWIGGISSYDGHAWELHPLVVHRGERGRGIGRALVSDLEEQVRRRGGLTIYLGTDDENRRTSLGGVDLYPDVLGALGAIQDLGDHPFDFYRRVGFAIVGVIPDANGFGKPDILMAKRVAPGPLPPRSARAGAAERHPGQNPGKVSVAYTIRFAVAGDIDTLVAFTVQEAYEAERIVSDEAAVRRGVEGGFRNPPLATYWVAETSENRVVASTSVVTEWSDFHGGYYWWIQSLFIVPEHRGGVLVQLLIDHLARAAAASGALDLRLYAHSSNERALRAYRRRGFSVARYVIMTRRTRLD